MRWESSLLGVLRQVLSKVGRAGPKPHRASNGMERAFPLLDCTSPLSATSRPLFSSIPRPAWQRGRLGEQLLLPRPTELPLGRAQPHVTYLSRCFRLARPRSDVGLALPPVESLSKRDM